jgi:hypothetical protein
MSENLSTQSQSARTLLYAATFSLVHFTGPFSEKIDSWLDIIMMLLII